jgi:hypothetical protein
LLESQSQLAFIDGGIILQMLWPKREFTFVLKTSSNDVHKIVSENVSTSSPTERDRGSLYRTRLEISVTASIHSRIDKVFARKLSTAALIRFFTKPIQLLVDRIPLRRSGFALN